MGDICYCFCEECIEELVDRYGEIHVYVEEHESVEGDEPIGLRNGSSYHYNKYGVKINAKDTNRFVPYDRIVYVEEAADFPD